MNFDLPPHQPSENALDQMRQALALARSDKERASANLARSSFELEQLKRSFGADDQRVRTAQEWELKAKGEVKATRTKERELRDGISNLIATRLPKNPAEDFGKLSAEYPVVLLPVRIETIFAERAGGGSELRIRVYPDEIASDTHEPALMDTEQRAGEAYWQLAWDRTKERDAWRVIVTNYPATRAAWIVHQMTPTNLASRPEGAPLFPTIDNKPQSWNRAAESRVLPDRWIVLAYRDGREVRRAVSSVVRDPLALSFDPNADANDPVEASDLSGDGLKLDHEMAWTVDFERAEQFGMAMRMPLDATDLEQGFHRLLVLGVKASLAPDQAGARLAELFDAHHYTRGFAFVRQGTPTNNTSAARSGFPPPDLGEANSFAIERGNSLNVPGGNGPLFARALGLPTELMNHVEGANLTEQQNARAMNNALWPCTLGYFLKHMMEPVFTDVDIGEARRFFVENVRGRGPLPIFRVGGTPYALLPVTSLTRWQPASNASATERELPQALRVLRGIWTQSIPNVPRIGRTTDPDLDLIETLGMDASTREARIRQAFGSALQDNLFNFYGIDIVISDWLRLRLLNARTVLDLIGHPEWAPRIVEMIFAETADLFDHHQYGLITTTPLSEEAGLAFNYIRWIRNNISIKELRQENFPTGVEHPKALLYLLLRHAALVEYARITRDLLIKFTGARAEDFREPEMVGIVPGTEQWATIWQRFDTKIPAVTGNKTVAEYLLSPRTDLNKIEVAAFRASLAALENLSTAELERLFTETLDTCSHRLDAWITALPSRRLEEMRTRRPLGGHIGAYGWVEDLHPSQAKRHSPTKLSDGRTGRVQKTSGGYIHAPSMNHAAAAAILRNAFLTRSGDERLRYAIDLSSERVRTALFLLDTVREGQQLGAVLGYRFERALHEGHVPLELDKYIDPFRNIYPLVANKGSNSGEPAEAIAARNVVDGLSLRTAWRENRIPFGTQGLPASGPDRTAIEEELRKLDEDADAVADLLLGESVYQIIRGNTSASAASLDALAQGVRPPSPEIAIQPRSGTGLTHRIGVVLGGEPLPDGDWGTMALTPRATAESYLDRWVGALLGNPANVWARVSYLDPQPEEAEHRTEVIVKLADLELRPLDVLALAKGVTTEAQATELDLRIAWVAFGVAPTATEMKIHYAPNPAWDREVIRSFPEILEVAQAINAVLGSARPLQPEDLLTPEKGQAASSADRLPAELSTRATDIVTTFTAVREQLNLAISAIGATPADSAPDLTALRTALRTVSLYGIPAAFPTTRHESSVGLRGEMLTTAQSVLKEVDRRIADANAATEPRDKVRAVLGRDFLFLPRFKPAEAAELDQALAAGSALVGSPNAVRKWFQQAAPVHTPLARWRKMALYTQTLTGHPLNFDVAQIPHITGARWVALPFADESQRPPGGCVSLVLHRAQAPVATEAWVGFIFDEWTELIANKAEQTAVAIHYDDPGAEAPQAVLLAVPPTAARNWDLDTVVDILHETLDLAKLRAVDSELLGSLGQLLPAIYVPENPADDTVSTPFSLFRVSNFLIQES